MASKSIESFRRTVVIEWPRMHEAQAKALLIQKAREGHAQIVAQAEAGGGGRPDFEAYANRPGNPIENVTLPGPIVYKYRYVREMIAYALAELRRQSPVQSGKYRDSHTLFVNGIAVEALPLILKPTDEIWIANPVPYSRKLEIGKTKSGRDFLITVPNRIYERVAKQKLMPRYHNIAKITITHILVPDAYRLKTNNPARSWLKNTKRWYYAPGQRADRAAGAPVRSPAIIIEMVT